MGDLGVPIPEEKINIKNNLKISQENKVQKMTKKKIVVKGKKIKPSKKVLKFPKENLQEWLKEAGELIMPVKMLRATGNFSKNPTNQVSHNGKPFPGWKEEGKTARKQKSSETDEKYEKTKMGYWARPEDFNTLTPEQIAARNSECAWAIPKCKGTHSAKKFAWIDVDTEFIGPFLQDLLDNHPYYPSGSNPMHTGNKSNGRVHIPVLLKNRPDEFPEEFAGVGNILKTKCYIIDEVSEKADNDLFKVELYAGGWLYFNKDTKMINFEKGVKIIDYTKFIQKIRRKPVSTQKKYKKKPVINHKIEDKKISEKDLEKFIKYSRLILEKIWDRTKGRLDEGGSWVHIMKAAKWEGMKWGVWDKLCKEFPNQYNFEKNKKKWEDLIQAECYDYDLNTIRTMARGWKDENGEPQGRWKEYQELDSHFTQAEKFCRFRFNKICIEAKKLVEEEMEAAAEEISDLQEDLQDLKDEKKKEKDRKKKKDIREKIKELEEEINECKESGIDEDKHKAIINDCYNKCKCYFEKFHFKIKFPKVGFAISNKTDIYFIIKGDMIGLYENLQIPVYHPKGYVEKEWVKEWVKDINIRTLNTCDFLPPPLERDYDTFNLFRGLAGSRIPNEVEEVSEKEMLDIFGEHIKILVGGDDVDYKNKEDALDPYTYMMMTLAHQIQKPGEIPEVAPVIVGQQGTGKSVWIKLFAEKLKGREYLLSTSNIKDIVGDFNQIDRKLDIVMEEASGRATFASANAVKERITEPRVNWVQKYKDGMMINNCATYYFLSNDRTPIKIELGDRRFVVFVCSPKWKQAPFKEKTEYFNRLVAAFNDPRYVKAFYNYLKNYDMTLPVFLQPNKDPNGTAQFHPKNNRPFTARYCDIQSVNVPKPYYFFNQYVEISGINNINAGDPDESPELYMEEVERIEYEKTHLKRKNGDVIDCNKHKKDSKADIWEMYAEYLDHMGFHDYLTKTDCTKFWRKIGSWVNDKQNLWNKAIEFEENENGVSIAIVKPIEMRECLKEIQHLLQV